MDPKIKYITDNNEIILMGNISTKQIISKSGNISKMIKRLDSFKKRLKYECSVNNVSYEEINKCNTSKMYSICGKILMKSQETIKYECEKQKTKMKRHKRGYVIIPYNLHKKFKYNQTADQIFRMELIDLNLL